jgi:inosose dehydratase
MNNPVANAPVSYGAFERTIGTPEVPDAEALLQSVADAGYDGIDLGPVGYLGRGAQLRAALEAHGLGLAGGYVELPFSDPERLGAAWHELDAVLDAFDAVQGIGVLPPRPTLAHTTTPARAANPGRGEHAPSAALSRVQRQALADGVAEALERCRRRGYEPTFHPETGTPVEGPTEIEALLSSTEIGLCLDTGHLLVAGGDPVRAARDWASRINQVHVKDARLDVMAGIASRGESADAVWSNGVFCTLGQGDLDVSGLIEALTDTGYGGWIVVEQDSIPRDRATFDIAVEAQRLNRAYLQRHGL